MTGKRFELNNIVKKGTVNFWDNKKQKILNASHSLDLLNELADENEQLRKDSTVLILANQDYRKENEQLKQFIQELTTKGTGRIDLANGYSYKVNAILTDFKR